MADNRAIWAGRGGLGLGLGLLLAGGALFFGGIAHESLWYDEAFSAAVANRPLGEIWRITASDHHPPLYYMMLRAFRLLFGRSELALRSLSALGALALAALGLGPVRRIFGTRTGLLFTLLIIIAPITHGMAQEARMYTWAAFFVTAAALYGYLAAAGGRRGDWAAFGGATVAAAYTHHYALMAVAVICLALLAWLAARGRGRLRPYLLTVGLAALAYLPWATVVIGQAQRVSRDFWIPPVTGQVILNTLTYPFNYKFADFFVALLALLPYLVCMALAARGLAGAARNREQGSLLLAVACLGYALTIAGGVLASYLIRPVLVERYMVPVLGLFFLPVAYGLGRLPGRWWLAGAGALLAFSAPLHVQIAQQRFSGPMFEVVASLHSEVRPGDVFLHTDAHTFGTFAYYYPEHQHLLHTDTETSDTSYVSLFSPSGMASSSLQSLLQGRSRVWLAHRLTASGETTPKQCVDSGDLRIVGEERHFRLPRSWYAVAVCRAEVVASGAP